MKLISVVTPAYNEEGNVEELYREIKEIFKSYEDKYKYEHIFIDNASTDNTANILRDIALKDKNVKVILNSRNFGHIRSPVHALMQASGDAVIHIVSDFQDPPHLIKEFIKKWEEGYNLVLGVKESSDEKGLTAFVRNQYYDFVNRISDVELTKNNTGFGLYSKKIIDVVKQIDDPYPYFRGMVSDIGFESAKVEYHQPQRRRGITKNNFYTLYDIAMLGITTHSKVPLRVVTITGFIFSAISFLIAIIYFIGKLLFWNSFALGVAPMTIGVFFFGSVQLFALGIIGEYIGFMHTQILKRPLVVEKERINFE